MFASLLLLKSCSLSALQARLKVAAHQAEEESEDTAENFLEGRTDIDEFLTNFMEKRMVRSGTVSYLSNVTFEGEWWSDFWCFFTALPQQKSQRGEVATVYQLTVPRESLEHKVQRSPPKLITSVREKHT